MIVLTENVMAREGYFPAETDVTDKLSKEVKDALIKQGKAVSVSGKGKGKGKDDNANDDAKTDNDKGQGGGG